MMALLDSLPSVSPGVGAMILLTFAAAFLWGTMVWSAHQADMDELAKNVERRRLQERAQRAERRHDLPLGVVQAEWAADRDIQYWPGGDR